MRPYWQTCSSGVMEAIGFAMITRLGEGSFDKDGNLDVVASDGIAFCCDGATSQIVTFIG